MPRIPGLRDAAEVQPQDSAGGGVCGVGAWRLVAPGLERGPECDPQRHRTPTRVPGWPRAQHRRLCPRGGRLPQRVRVCVWLYVCLGGRRGCNRARGGSPLVFDLRFIVYVCFLACVCGSATLQTDRWWTESGRWKPTNASTSFGWPFSSSRHSTNTSVSAKGSLASVHLFLSFFLSFFFFFASLMPPAADCCRLCWLL